jgi:ferrous iron transport protein A
MMTSVLVCSGASTHLRRTAVSKDQRICESDSIGRILNYDQLGRSFFSPLFRRRPGARQLSVLSELNVGESGVVVVLDLPDSVQNHLMHMGFVPDALVTALRRAPAGDPTVYAVDGLEIALRRETATAIQVRKPNPAHKALQFDQSPELLEVTR